MDAREVEMDDGDDPRNLGDENDESREEDQQPTQDTGSTVPEAEEPESNNSNGETPVAEGDLEPKPDLQWYVLKVASNRERTIKESIERRIKRDGLEKYFGEIIIPTEKVVDTKGGKKKVREEKLFAGYLMVYMEINDDTWYLVRDTAGVGDFAGAAGKPIPMKQEEIDGILGREAQKDEEEATVKIDLSAGDTVKVTEGAFESFEGRIDAIDQATGKITVIIEIFNRETPIDLDYWQVERG